MAGRGPTPKPAARRARTNSDPVGVRVVESAPVAQPPLPDEMPGGMGWPARTVEWWQMWGNDPLAADFRATDWSELMDCALIHAQVWSGEIKLAGELRLRTAKFGATAEDRARLRIQFAAADDAEDRRDRRKTSGDSRAKYKGLKAVD